MPRDSPHNGYNPVWTHLLPSVLLNLDPTRNSDCNYPQILASFFETAPSIDLATWVHEPSVIKDHELRDMAELLGRSFGIHHPDAVGGISLTHNPDPKRFMVMHYHSVGNGFRLPLHGLIRDICRTFEFPLVS